MGGMVLGMIRRSRFPAATLALLGIAALASSLPVVRWCSRSWCEVTLADYAGCRGEAQPCTTGCGGGEPATCESSGEEATAAGDECSGASCPASDVPARDGGGRAFCLAAPASATFAAGVAGPQPPALQPSPWPVATALRPAVTPHRFVCEPSARPPTDASLDPPPVRGPPATA